jgi:hypothetical protein
VYTPSHEALEQVLLLLNKKLDEMLILLLWEFLDEVVSAGEPTDPEESECIESDG